MTTKQDKDNKNINKTRTPVSSEPQPAELGRLTAAEVDLDFLNFEEQPTDQVQRLTTQQGSDDVVKVYDEADRPESRPTTAGTSVTELARRIHKVTEEEVAYHGLRAIVAHYLDKGRTPTEIEKACVTLFEKGHPILKQSVGRQLRKDPDAKAKRAREIGDRLIAEIRAKREAEEAAAKLAEETAPPKAPKPDPVPIEPPPLEPSPPLVVDPVKARIAGARVLANQVREAVGGGINRDVLRGTIRDVLTNHPEWHEEDIKRACISIVSDDYQPITVASIRDKMRGTAVTRQAQEAS